MRVVRPQRLGASYARCLAPAARSFSFFSEIPLAPADPILNTALLYKADTDPKKVNLGIGAYRTEEGKPWVLPVVQKAEEQMLSELGKTLDKEYLGVDGLATLKEATQKLILGQALSRVASVQTLSGTGSLRVAAEFIHWHLGKTKMFYSDPTWGNHPAIFKRAGMETEAYPYWDAEKKSIKFDAWLQHVQQVPEGSLYLMHPCAHNPTGMDPTLEQWKQIVSACVEKKHVVILDSAYQGYASGDLAHDRQAIELFLATGLEMFVCQSFAK